MNNLWITNASIFNGQVFLPGHYNICVNQGRIKHISPHLEPQPDQNDIMIDAELNTVMPALIEGHCHFMATAWQKHSLDLSSVSTLPAAQELLQNYAAKLDAGEWIRGGGWSLQNWGHENIHMKFLDECSPERPVALESQDFHSIWINNVARKILGIPENPQDTVNGRYGKDNNNRFNGILFEQARNIVYEKIPDPSFNWICASLDKSIPRFWKHGFTGCIAMETKNDIRYWNNYRQKGGRPFSISWFAPYTLLDEIIGKQLVSGDLWDQVVLGGIKLFADGSFGSLTAEVTQPYKTTGDYGVGVMDQKILESLVQKSHRHQLATAIHAIGDKAVNRVLKAYDLSFKSNPWAVHLRNRMEHVQLLSEKAIKEISQKRLGVAIQPNHIVADIDIIGAHLPDRKKECYPFRRFEEENVRLLLSSDAPVADIHPWRNIYLALSQTDPDNKNHFLNRSQTLTLEKALKGYTSDAAVYGYHRSLGYLGENFPAELIILNTNLQKITHPEDILEVETRTTISNGKIVYQNQETA